MDKRINKLGMFNTVVAALVAGVASLCGPAVFAAGEGDKPVVMEDKMAPEPEPKGPLEEFQDSIFGGKVNLNLRLRFEHVNDETGSPGGGRRGQGYAFTERLRLGYGTKPFHGFSAYAEFEDIRAISDNTYDDTTNGNTDEAVIADPADTELNQAFVKYANEWFEFIGDRQRLILDDARFVGNVGWRQNEQTFDAITAKIKPIKDVEVLYSYFFHINRIFGPDADADFDSDSHIVNASYSGLPWGKLTVFAYILDFDNAAANSTNTFGFRFAGSQAINDEWSVGYIGSFARQTDGHDSPLEYEANYFLVEGSVTRKGWGTVGVGYEMLGSDDGVAAFRTPLATLHKFNGWADVFLGTPAAGLTDLYVYAGTTLPWDVKGKVVYHYFHADDDNTEFGHEVDIVFSKAITKHISILAKYADFWGDSSFADRRKVWLQVEIKY